MDGSCPQRPQPSEFDASGDVMRSCQKSGNNAMGDGYGRQAHPIDEDFASCGGNLTKARGGPMRGFWDDCSDNLGRIV